MAWWAIRFLGALDLPIVVDLSLDVRVLLFAVVLSLVTGVAFGLAPALKATRIDLVPTLRDDGETRSADQRWFTLKNSLVVFQVAVSVALLGGTSFFLQMLLASRTVVAATRSTASRCSRPMRATRVIPRRRPAASTRSFAGESARFPACSPPY